MKNLFPGYYRPTQEEFNQMWQDGIFAFDANMLLNIYRYTPKTQESFFIILEKLKDRIWIPYQAAMEFYRRRIDVINGQIKAYDEITSKIDLAYDALKAQLQIYKKHASVNIDQVFKVIESGIKRAKKSLEKDKENHPDLSINDPLRDKIADLFNGKVGDQFNDKKLLEIYSKAKQRFDVLKPPGFKDLKGKEFPDMYGDVVIWFQIIEHAKKEKKPLIFITDDRKEDWWQREAGQTVCPRPELTAEIWSEAKVPFYMYHSDQFIKFALEFLDIKDQQSAVEEVQEIRKQDEAQEILQGNYAAANYLLNAGLASVAEKPAWLEAFASTAGIANAALTKNAASIIGSNVSGVNAALAMNLSPLMANTFGGINDSIAKTLGAIVDQSAIAKSVAPMFQDRFAGINAAIADTMAPLARESVLGMNAAIQSTASKILQDHHENLRRLGLYGRSISRRIEIDLSPKHSSEFPADAEPKTIFVEAPIIPINEHEQDFENESNVEMEEAETIENIPTYEFDNFPRIVTLIHHKDSPNSYDTLHKVRKPTDDEWIEWANEIRQTRRYLTPDELEAENAKKDPEDEEITEMFESSYSEMEASDHLYQKIILEIAGVTLDEEDEFPHDQFREIDHELIKENSFQFSETVITDLYECYCQRRKSAKLKNNEVLISQDIRYKSQDFIINHILREPTEEESKDFRTQIVKAFFTKDDEDQEVIELKLNLSAAIDLYSKLLINIENATVRGEVFSEETKAMFLEVINPVFKFRVLTELLNINVWNFKIDDTILG